MSDPTLDPSMFDTITRDAHRSARIMFWAKFVGGLTLYAAVVIVVLGAAVGIARWLAGL